MSPAYDGREVHIYGDTGKEAWKIQEPRVLVELVNDGFWKVQATNIEEYCHSEKLYFEKNEKLQNWGNGKFHCINRNKGKFWMELIWSTWEHLHLWTVQSNIKSKLVSFPFRIT